ncbi:MAG: guanylate kinase [Pseudomonadota bacterium]|nr:guanylate kinase [Pseudomonadota bacterium]
MSAAITTAGSVFVVAAPSGAGKSSLVRELLVRDPGLRLSVSHTTRAPRPGEQDGREYHFVSRADFDAMRAAGEFLECAEVYGNGYATSAAWIRGQLAAGEDVILEIDWQGARQVRALFPGCASVFILPPSLAALRERLEGRGTDSQAVIEHRLEAAREDLSHVDEFEYVIINAEFFVALEDLSAIVRAQRCRRSRQFLRHPEILPILDL